MGNIFNSRDPGGFCATLAADVRLAGPAPYTLAPLTCTLDTTSFPLVDSALLWNTLVNPASLDLKSGQFICPVSGYYEVQIRYATAMTFVQVGALGLTVLNVTKGLCTTTNPDTPSVIYMTKGFVYKAVTLSNNSAGSFPKSFNGSPETQGFPDVPNLIWSVRFVRS